MTARAAGTPSRLVRSNALLCGTANNARITTLPSLNQRRLDVAMLSAPGTSYQAARSGLV